MASSSYFQKTVTLLDWWLTKPQTNDHSQTLTLGVAGFTSQQNRPARCFSSAPILKIFDLFELETVDDVCVILQGHINKQRTLDNGFPPQVFDHFVIGFPPYWKLYCPKIESAVAGVQGEDSVEGYGKPQNSDSYTVDMGVQDCKDVMLNNKSSKPSAVEIPHEHITERSTTPEFKDDPSLKMSPVDSSTLSKCLGISSRRMTRSMKKADSSKHSFPLFNDIDPGIIGGSENLNNKAVNVVNCDIKSKSRNIDSKASGGYGIGSNETASCSEDTVIKMESKRKQIDQNGDVTKDKRNKDDAVVSGESHINISDLEDIHITPKCSDPSSVGVTDVNDDVGTNMKGYRKKKKNRVDLPQKDGVPATHGTRSKEAVKTQTRSKIKLPVKRKLVTSPKSAFSRGKKEEWSCRLWNSGATKRSFMMRMERCVESKDLSNNNEEEEHIVEAGNEVVCERSSVTPEFKNDRNLEMSPIVDSSAASKCLGVSSRRITRSMKKLDNSKNSDIDSKSSGDAHVSGESQINIRICDLEDIHITPKCSDQLSNTSVGNDDIVIARTNMKSCRNKKKNRVDIPQKGVPATHRISPEEAVMNRNMSKTKLPVKRKLITSPKSASSRGKKGSEEGYGSAIILSVESFSGKKSRSGRVLLPPLEFWRNQKVVYDEHGEVCGVEEPK